MPVEVKVRSTTLAIVRDRTFMTTDERGEILADSEHGLYAGDTRFVSHYQLLINELPWKLLGSASVSHHAERLHFLNPAFKIERGEVAGGEISLTVIRSVADGVHEDLDITNYSMEHVEFDFEVQLRSDFADIYRHAKRRGFLITLFSNGTLMTERIADLLAEYPPHGIEFTLYGMSDATYLATTGFPGRFAKVRRAIDLMLERRLPLTLKAVAMEPLKDELEAMKRMAADLGVHFRFDTMVHGALDGSAAPLKTRSEPGRVVGLDAADEGRMRDWMTFYRQFVKPVTPSPWLMSCGAGINSFHIDPKGTLLSCEALPLDGYDLRRGSFRDGWYGIVGDVRKRPAAASNVCAGCELRSMCDRCPATAMMETGSPDGWLPYFCEITHRRAALFEERLGNETLAARYRAHAERVAGGWVPGGAILPPASGAKPAGTGCASGGCASGGCTVKAAQPDSTPSIVADRPAGRVTTLLEERHES